MTPFLQHAADSSCARGLVLGHIHCARKLSQFHDNLACLDLKLDSTQMERLDQVSKIELGFPHDFYAREMVRSFMYAGMREQIVA